MYYILFSILILYSIIGAVSARKGAKTDSTPSRQTTSSVASNVTTQKVQLKNYSFPSPILLEELRERRFFYNISDKKDYNWGILGFDVSNFMSYAAYFCRYEGRKGEIEVVSVGSENGVIVDQEIIDMYYGLFGNATKLDITLVDAHPKSKVDFKTVDDLIAKRPQIVGNCVLLVIWPNRNDTYDIDAVRKLRPRALLTLYEAKHGWSGSSDFRAFLNRCEGHYKGDGDEDKMVGLDTYAVGEVVNQEVHFCAGYTLSDNTTVSPQTCLMQLRMTKLKRIG